MDKNLPTSADVIIVGGGAAGCVVASRIATSQPELSILLIESGPNNFKNPNVLHPGLFGLNLAPEAGVSTLYTSKPQPETLWRTVPVLAPNVVGGGGSINFMMYARALARDFDSWKIPGWKFQDVLPFLKELECLVGDVSKHEMAVHGTNGPFQVGVGCGFSRHTLFEEDCLQAITGAGTPIVADSQDLYTAHGGSAIISWVNPTTGLRQDPAHVLLHPLLQRKESNLTLLSGIAVERILLDDTKTARGVIVSSRNSGYSGEKVTIKARRMVVLAAGALGSPQILERSGIGNPECLSKARVATVHALPGVGQTYLDHQFLSYKYRSKIGAENALDDLWAGRVPWKDSSQRDNEILRWNGFGAIGKLQLQDHDLKTFDLDFQQRYKTDFPTDRPVALFAASSVYIGDHSPGGPAEHGQYFSFATALAYGYSSGSIHISGPNLSDGVDFDAGFLKDEDDLKVLIWEYKKTRGYARRMKFYNGLAISSHPSFSSTSKASAEVDDTLVISHQDKSKLEDILYTKEDDTVIADFIRKHVGTMWHSAGTCPMGSEAAGGVVDARLSVHGISQLKIADLSILPSMVGGNTYSTALLVGQKAASLFIEELQMH